jgi:hypothetical protein
MTSDEMRTAGVIAFGLFVLLSATGATLWLGSWVGLPQWVTLIAALVMMIGAGTYVEEAFRRFAPNLYKSAGRRRL